MLELLVLVFLFNCVCYVVTIEVAASKNRSSLAYLALTVLMPVIGLLVVLLVPPRPVPALD